MNRFDYDQIPPLIRESLDAYARTGRRCGHFLTAVLQDDLFGACGRADDDSLRTLPVIVTYIYNCLPGECWGSPEKVKAWHEKRGLEALEPAGPGLVQDFLALVMDAKDVLRIPTMEEIAGWTQQERDDVVAWARAIHLHATRPLVPLPARPARVPEWLRP